MRIFFSQMFSEKVYAADKAGIVNTAVDDAWVIIYTLRLYYNRNAVMRKVLNAKFAIEMVPCLNRLYRLVLVRKLTESKFNFIKVLLY